VLCGDRIQQTVMARAALVENIKHGPAFQVGAWGTAEAVQAARRERPDTQRGICEQRSWLWVSNNGEARSVTGPLRRAALAHARRAIYSAAWRDWLCCCSIAPVNASTPFS
jgi:hypothetical protein